MITYERPILVILVIIIIVIIIIIIKTRITYLLKVSVRLSQGKACCIQFPALILDSKRS